jgi:hypothetical protein
MPPKKTTAASIPKAKRKKSSKSAAAPLNIHVDHGIDGSTFKASFSVIAQRSQAVKDGYVAALDAALVKIKEIIAQVAKDSGYEYAHIEDDILATSTARVRTRAICGWNAFCGERLRELNAGEYLFASFTLVD